MTVFNLDLDEEIINHLADPESVATMRAEGLVVDVIEVPRVAEVFEWQMRHVREHGKPATGTVLEAQFTNIQVFEQQTVVRDLIHRLRERFARNKSRDVLRALTKRSIEKPTDFAQDLIHEGRQLMKVISPRGEAYGPEDVDRVIADYHRQVVEGRGCSLGFQELDDHFFGQRGMTFMVGAPKSMKSWFTIKTLLANILDGKVPYLYSLELPPMDAEMRLLCMATGIPFWKYIKQKFSPGDLDKLKLAQQALGDFQIEKPPSGHRGIEYLIERARDYGADVIMIDQLQYVENQRNVALGALNDTGEYWGTINTINDYSDDGPIWVVHQFNRSVMGTEKMPDFQQIKGSAAIEECATLCLGLWANSEMKKSSLVQIGTLVTRHLTPLTWEAKINFKNDQNIQIIGEAE